MMIFHESINLKFKLWIIFFILNFIVILVPTIFKIDITNLISSWWLHIWSLIIISLWGIILGTKWMISMNLKPSRSTWLVSLFLFFIFMWLTFIFFSNYWVIFFYFYLVLLGKLFWFKPYYFMLTALIFLRYSIWFRISGQIVLVNEFTTYIYYSVLAGIFLYLFQINPDNL